MILVLIESEFNCITSVIDHFTSLYNKKSVVKITGSRVKDNISSMLTRKPLLDNGWLIICTDRISTALLKEWDLPFNNIIVHIPNSGKLSAVLDKLGDIDYQLFDNSKVNPELVKQWVAQQLHCNEVVASSVVSRCNHRLKNIVLAVDSLKHFENVNLSLVNQYVPKVSTVSVNDVVLYLLRAQDKDIKMEEVVKTVSEFRYAYKWLLDTIEDEIRATLSVFDEMHSGNLSLENYKDFLKQTDNKHVLRFSEYKLKRVIELQTRVSTEYAYYVLCSIEGIPRSFYGLYRLLFLIKMIGEK